MNWKQARCLRYILLFCVVLCLLEAEEALICDLNKLEVQVVLVVSMLFGSVLLSRDRGEELCFLYAIVFSKHHYILSWKCICRFSHYL